MARQLQDLEWRSNAIGRQGQFKLSSTLLGEEILAETFKKVTVGLVAYR